MARRRTCCLQLPVQLLPVLLLPGLLLPGLLLPGLLLPVTASFNGRDGSMTALPGGPAVITYRAAATQYTPSSDWSSGAGGILEENFNTILQLAQKASLQGADIVVFPEYGLTGTDLGSNRSLFRSMCQVVPSPGDGRVPCTEDVQADNYWMTQMLSCLALELDMYLVVDLSELYVPEPSPGKQEYDHDNPEARDVECHPNCELKEGAEPSINGQREGIKKTGSGSFEAVSQEMNAEDFVAYNTQVVFDRTGAVVARYRKKHLFFEPEFEYGDEDDSTALFTTDFGVTFTLQVCFDIMYSRPAVVNIVKAGVRDVAMSTAWIDELPFLTAPQIFRGFSRGLSSNLIVSNLFNPSAGEVGSGIFHGDHSKGEQYTYDTNVGTPVVIVDDLTTAANAGMWANFKAKREFQAVEQAEEIIQRLSELECISEENVDPSVGQGVSKNKFMESIFQQVENRQFFFKNETHTEKIVHAMLSNQRQVTEWQRIHNRLKCSQLCTNVKSLLEANLLTGAHYTHSKGPQTRVQVEASLVTNKLIKNSAVDKSEVAGFDSKTYENNSNTDDILAIEGGNKNYQFIIHENVSFYAYQILPSNPSVEDSSVQTCYGSFCCEAWYSQTNDTESSEFPRSSYMLLAYNGTVAKGSGTYWMWTQVCGIVFCAVADDVNSCAAFDEPAPELNSNFRLRNMTGNFETPFIFPSIFNLNFELVNHTSWSSSTALGQLQMHQDVDNLLTAVLFGRKYSFDP